MIISFEIPLPELMSLDRELVEDRVSALLRAHRRGTNLAVFSRPVSRWLLENIKLIGRDQSTLSRIQLQTTQTGDLIRRAPCLLRILPPGVLFKTHDARSIQLPINNKYFEDIINKPVLVVEDIIVDAEILKFVFNNMPPKAGGLSVAYEAIHGGGDRIWAAAEAKVSERRIVVAVGDSDRKSPLSKPPKSDYISRIVQRVNWPLFFCRLTPCSEVENMFGLDVLGTLARISRTPSYTSLTTIASGEIAAGHAVAERYELFFDIKEGISEAKISGISNSSVQAWIEQKLQFANISKASCNLLGFGEKVAKELLATNQCMSQFRRTIRSNEWQEVFESFVVEIMWILAASPMQRT